MVGWAGCGRSHVRVPGDGRGQGGAVDDDFAVVVIYVSVRDASRASQSNPVDRLDETCKIDGEDPE
eukprot:2445369-Pyramimonas_sp.AAC.1